MQIAADETRKKHHLATKSLTAAPSRSVAREPLHPHIKVAPPHATTWNAAVAHCCPTQSRQSRDKLLWNQTAHIIRVHPSMHLFVIFIFSFICVSRIPKSLTTPNIHLRLGWLLLLFCTITKQLSLFRIAQLSTDSLRSQVHILYRSTSREAQLETTFFRPPIYARSAQKVSHSWFRQITFIQCSMPQAKFSVTSWCSHCTEEAH